MSVVALRRLSPALACALAAAALAGCSLGGTRGGIPEDAASDLRREVEDVQQAVDREDCQGIDAQILQINERIDNLPRSVSDRLVQSLRDGVVRLETVTVEECNALATEEPTVPEETPPAEEAPEEETPAPEEETPAPEEETPAPEEETPTPEEPAPDEETPEQPEEPEGGTPAPDPGTPEGGATP